MHILLIEDDLDLGRALQSALKVEGQEPVYDLAGDRVGAQSG